jgi:hypothetical protein
VQCGWGVAAFLFLLLHDFEAVGHLSVLLVCVSEERCGHVTVVWGGGEGGR